MIISRPWRLDVLFVATLVTLTVTCCASTAFASGPVFARCVKVVPEGKVYHGNFTSSKCSTPSPEKTGKYEGYLGAEGAELTVSAGAVTFESSKKSKLTCSAASGGGQVAGSQYLGDVTLTFSGCEADGAKCTTAEAKEEGIIATPVLVGALGFVNKERRDAALEFHTAPASEPFFEASCGGVPVKVQGSVLVPVKTGKAATALSLKFTGKGGVQKLEAFEGGSAHHLEISSGGGSFEALSLKGKFVSTIGIEVQIYPYTGYIELFVPEMFKTGTTIEYSNGFIHDGAECCGGGWLAGGEQYFTMPEAQVRCFAAHGTATEPGGFVSTLAIKPKLENCSLTFLEHAAVLFGSSPYTVGPLEPSYVYTGQETLELTSGLVLEPISKCKLEILPQTWKAAYVNGSGFMGATVGGPFGPEAAMTYEWSENCTTLNTGFPSTDGGVSLPDEFFGAKFG